MRDMGREDSGKHKRSRIQWVAVGVLAFFAFATAVIAFAIHHAEPGLPTETTETIYTQFQGRVELTGLHGSVAHGLQVSGEGLKIFGRNDLNIHQPGVQPLITVDEFRFSAGMFNLLHTPMRVHRLYLKGLELNIPPREQSAEGISLKKRKIKIYVDEFVCEQARLVINTLKSDKLPLEFVIANLDMKRIEPGQPLRLIATLVNRNLWGTSNRADSLGRGKPMIREARQ